MLTAVFADLHSNREAFSACLAHAEACHARRHIFLGDYVGYGADPCWIVDTVMRLVAQGATAVLGNHDAAVFSPREELNDAASAAIAWTRRQLTAAQTDFLRTLPLTVQDGDFLFVHASAFNPREWHYAIDASAALRSFTATPHRVTFCGHVHLPEIYHLNVTGKLASFVPVPGTAITLVPQRRWLAVIGSVGQPRDGAPVASYALLDEEQATLTYLRVPYDASTAAAKVRKAGLPEVLSLRLLSGR